MIKTILVSGYGINCEEETQYAFEKCGSQADIVHVNDLIENPGRLKEYQIFVFPGGFSYGDDTGSGKALSNRIKANLLDEIQEFTSRDTLMLGICNGFQVMVNLGLVPSLDNKAGEAQAALEYNNTFRYQCRWVDLKIEKDNPSVFTKGIDSLHVPVAHGEGNFFASPEVLKDIEDKNLVTMRYINSNGDAANQEFPANPNGSLNDIASICDPSGRIMGMMPHPERGMFVSQRDDWPNLKEDAKRKGTKLPEETDGIIIFQNAVTYFK